MERKTVLVVDDDKDLRMMVTEFLRADGYEVFTASNGEEALEKIQKKPPDLIVLDMNMPKMGGIAVYHHICEMKLKEKISVVVMTARENLRELFEDLQADGFLSKPFEIAVLRKKIRSIFEQRAAVLPAVSADGATGAPGSGAKLLLIENDEAAAEKVAAVFAAAGFQTMLAGSGLEGAEAALRENPDAVLVKMELADIPGDLIAYKIKQIPKLLNVPVILYSQEQNSLDGEATRAICVKVGIQRISGVTDPTSLVRKIQDLLAK